MHETTALSPTPATERTKILVCVNDTPHSRVALRVACSKAKRLGCPVALLHVIEPIDYQNFMSVAEKMRKEKWEEAETLLQRLAQEAYDWAGVTPVLIIKEGLMGESIAAAVEEDYSINMLVVGTSPESPGRGTLLPWLAAQLGKRLLIPLLIVPGNLTELQINEFT